MRRKFVFIRDASRSATKTYAKKAFAMRLIDVVAAERQRTAAFWHQDRTSKLVDLLAEVSQQLLVARCELLACGACRGVTATAPALLLIYSH